MAEAFYVVEVYCFLNVLSLMQGFLSGNNDYIAAAISSSEFVLVFTLSVMTFRGKRLASRILSLYIGFSALYFCWAMLSRSVDLSIYSVYRMIVQTYFLIGAIKLWRIRELPTRFTDPPVEPPVHS